MQSVTYRKANLITDKANYSTVHHTNRMVSLGMNEFVFPATLTLSFFQTVQSQFAKYVESLCAVHPHPCGEWNSLWREPRRYDFKIFYVLGQCQGITLKKKKKALIQTQKIETPYAYTLRSVDEILKVCMENHLGYT